MIRKQYRTAILTTLTFGLLWGLSSCRTNDTITSSNLPYGTKVQTARALFLFSSEDGIISGWASGDNAVQVAKSASDKAVYKGLAIASLNGTHYLYATNFSESKIDIYDTGFHHQQGAPFQGSSFVDQGSPAIPSDYGPFGITNIGGLLYVTYAKHKAPDNHDDQAGPGNGYIDVFNPDGSFVKRLASNGTLNSPWGVTMSGSGFGQFSNMLLVNNFGDGHINVFKTDGTFEGQLEDANNNPIAIDGLWDVTFADPTVVTSGLDYNTLYFSAGPEGESHGLFGYIKPSGSMYAVTNLVSDTTGFGAARIDPNLVNGWGIAIGTSGKLWISSNGPGLSVVYDGNGNQVRSPVTIPARNASSGGTPSGAIFNATNDFMMSE